MLIIFLCFFSLHSSGADTKASDNTDMNPLMLAVEEGPSHLNVVKALIKKDPDLVSLKKDSGLSVIHWALEKQDRSTLFKV